MNSRADSSEQIDHTTSRSICDAVGERLQQNLGPVKSELPPHLEHLMDKLRKQDASGRRMLPNQGLLRLERPRRRHLAQLTGCVF